MIHSSFQKILYEAEEAYSEDEPLNEDASELENAVDNITFSTSECESSNILSVRFDSVLLQQVKTNKVKYSKELKSKLQHDAAEAGFGHEMSTPWINPKTKKTRKVIFIEGVNDYVGSSSAVEQVCTGVSVVDSQQFCLPQCDWSASLDEMMNNRKRGRSDSLEEDEDEEVASDAISPLASNLSDVRGAPTTDGSSLPIIGSLGSISATNSSMFDRCFDNNVVSLRNFIQQSIDSSKSILARGNSAVACSVGDGTNAVVAESKSLMDELNQIVVDEINRRRDNASSLSYEEVTKALERSPSGLLGISVEEPTKAVASSAPRHRTTYARTKEEKQDKFMNEHVAKMKRLREMTNDRISLDAAKSMEEDFKNKWGAKKYAETMVSHDQYLRDLKDKSEHARAERQAEKQRERESAAQAEKVKEKEKDTEAESKGGVDDTGSLVREVTQNQLRLLKLRGILNRPLAPQVKQPIWRCLPNASGIKASAKLNNLTPLHMLIARAHKNIPRVDLLASELRYFHRPHMPANFYSKSWMGTYVPPTNNYALQAQVRGGAADGTMTIPGSHQPHQTPTQAIDKNDLSLLTGDFVMLEYIEERPPLVLNVGMASSIVNYFRTQVEEGSGRDNTNTVRTTGTSAVRKLSHRIPQHVIQLLAKRNIKSFSESDESGPKLTVGELKILESRPNPIPDSIESNVSHDDQNSAAISEQLLYLDNLKDVNQNGPFLGNLQLDEIQQAIHNSMFKAPLFCHQVSSNPSSTGFSDGPMSQFTSNDFLLVRTKVTTKSIHYQVRELPLASGGVFVCGQIEPLQIVPKPAPDKAISKIQEKMFRLALARYLYTNPNGVDFKEAQDHILKFSRRKQTIRDKNFKNILKSVGDEYQNLADISSRGGIGTKWYPKSYSLRANTLEDPSYALGGKTASNSDWLNLWDLSYNFDKLESSVFPEEVCMQESCNAGEYALGEVGIFDAVDVVTVQQYIMTLMNVRQACERKILTLMGEIGAAQAAYTTKTQRMRSLELLVSVLVRDLRRMDDKILVCRFIVEKLVLTPWNVTEAYAKGHVQYDVGGLNTASNVATLTTTGGMTLTATVGRIDLFGMGDPSGVGEAYAFVRMPKLALTDRRKSKGRVLYNTDSDIRALERVDAEKIVLDAGYLRKQVKSLPRWDLMHLVREIATKAFNEKKGGLELWKYARNLDDYSADTDTSTNSYITDELRYKSKCNDVWNKQANALTVTDIEELDDDDDDDADFYASIGASVGSTFTGTATEAELTISLDKTLSQQQKEELEAQTSRSRLGTSMVSQVSNKTEKSGLKDLRKFMSSLPDGKSKTKTKMSVATDGRADVDMDALDKEIGLVGSVSSKGGSGAATGFVGQAPRYSILAPTKAVKRITTTINAETGVQTVEIKYSLLNLDVLRVGQKNEKKLRQHEFVTVPRRKQWKAAMSSKIDQAAVNAEANSSAAKTNYSGWNFYDDADENGSVVIAKDVDESASLKLDLGAMKDSTKSVDIDDADLYNLSAKTRIGASRTRGAASALTTVAARAPGRPSFAKLDAFSVSSSSANKATMYKDARLPQLMLAVKLEEILKACWLKKNASPFRYPVDVTKLVGYRERVQFPICLSDIQDKLGRLVYCTSADFHDDLKLMAYNSILFNTAAHDLSKAALDIEKYAATLLANERNAVGSENDSFRLLETAISAKYRAFNRPLNLHTSHYDSKTMPLPTSAQEKEWKKTGAPAGVGRPKRGGRPKGKKGAAAISSPVPSVPTGSETSGVAVATADIAIDDPLQLMVDSTTDYLDPGMSLFDFDEDPDFQSSAFGLNESIGGGTGSSSTGGTGSSSTGGTGSSSTGGTGSSSTGGTGGDDGYDSSDGEIEILDEG